MCWSLIVDNNDGRLAKITISIGSVVVAITKKKKRYKIRWGAVYLSTLVAYVVIHTGLKTQKQW